jgi:hypothetical protein
MFGLQQLHLGKTLETFKAQLVQLARLAHKAQILTLLEALLI